jgi:hypothetical protein
MPAISRWWRSPSDATTGRDAQRIVRPQRGRSVVGLHSGSKPPTSLRKLGIGSSLAALPYGSLTTKLRRRRSTPVNRRRSSCPRKMLLFAARRGQAHFRRPRLRRGARENGDSPRQSFDIHPPHGWQASASIADWSSPPGRFLVSTRPIVWPLGDLLSGNTPRIGESL